ncbi:translocation/assembly module TamB domain-containing protein, partial [Luteimonas sp. SDU101]
MAFRRARLPADISPEEREQRIAELRERRRRRLRMLAIRSALTSVVLVLLASVLLYWLLTTLGGRDFLLARIVAALPAGSELTWDSAEGPASGPLTLHGVRYVQRGCPDVEGQPVPYGQCAQPTTLTFTAQRVVLDPAIAPLVGRRLRLDALDVEGAVLDLPEPADTPFELPTWPEVLPRIDLPLSLQADTIRVDGLRLTRLGEALIDIATIRGGFDARQGELRIAGLVVDSDRGRFGVDGVYAPDEHYRTDLTASALLPAPFPRPRPRIGLVARGDLDHMDVAVVGHAPDPLRMALALRGKEWSLRASSEGLDPALLAGDEPGAPLSFNVLADGRGGAADLEGELRQGALHAVLQPSRLKLEEQVLELQPLVLDVFGGRITARGRGDFSEPRAADFRFAVNARGLRLAGDPQAPDPEPADPAPAIGVDADLGLAGTSSAWAVIGRAELARDDLRAQVELDGRGDLETLRLRTLRATTPGGRLDATGEVGWAPALRWDLEARLAGFDPGYFAPAFSGAIDGQLASKGGIRDDGGLTLDVQASELGGSLRGRALGGQASFAMQGPATGQTRTDYTGEAALRIGGSRIDARGTLAERLELDARLAPLDLADLLPGASGSLRGTVLARGDRTAPDLEADLDGSGLRWRDYAASALSIQGRLPWSGAGGELQLEGSGLQAGLALDQARIRARGAVENLELDAQARSEAVGSLALQGSARRDGAGWSGSLA